MMTYPMMRREREREREREDIFERRVWGWKCDNDINIWVWNFGLVDRLLGVLLLNLFIYLLMISSSSVLAICKDAAGVAGIILLLLSLYFLGFSFHCDNLTELLVLGIFLFFWL